MTYPQLHMIIDGEKVPVGQPAHARRRQPRHRGEMLGQLPLADAADLDRALAAAQRGFRLWRDVVPQQRAAVLAGAARLLRERQEADRAHRDAGGGQDARRVAHRSA